LIERREGLVEPAKFVKRGAANPKRLMVLRIMPQRFVAG